MSLIAVKVSQTSSFTSSSGPSGTAISDHLRANVQGRLLPFTDEAVSSLTDMAKITKLYKLTSSDSGSKSSKRKAPKMNGVSGAGAPVEGESKGVVGDRAEMEAVILGIMAMKGS